MLTDIFEGKSISIWKNTEEGDDWFVSLPFVTVTIPDFTLDDFAEDLIALGAKMKELGY